MESESDEGRRQLRHIYLLRLTLYVSFLAAVATTAFTLAASFYQPLAFGPTVSGPATQTLVASATVASTTTLFSSTVATFSTSARSLPGGYIVASPFTRVAFNYYGLSSLISWTVFGAALIWRGHVRSVWGQSRFSYDTFRLLVKMRGAQTRLKLMRSLNPPKNKLQLATALAIDWKAVDKHVQVLERNGLIQAASTSGTATFYEVTEKGRSLLQVLEQLSADTPPPAD